MHQAIAALSKAGINVIADHVLVEAQWLKACAELFSELRFISSRALPAEVLIQRSWNARRDAGSGSGPAPPGASTWYL
jgi:chloramphenicol 3-O-phosphotransferase